MEGDWELGVGEKVKEGEKERMVMEGEEVCYQFHLVPVLSE